MNYSVALETFVNLLNEREAAHATQRGQFFRTVYSVPKAGKKYDRVVRDYDHGNGPVGQISVYAFINRETGQIFKPASWKAPAKHARGSIFADNPLAGTGIYGVDSLR